MRARNYPKTIFDIPQAVLVNCILQDEADLLHTLGQTSKVHHNRVKQKLLQLNVNCLLNHVFKGERDAIQKEKPHSTAILQEAEVTDYSGREFNKISSIKLATWTLDTEVLKYLLAQLTPEAKIQAWKQIQEVEQKGISFSVYNVQTEKNERHQEERQYNFSELVNQLDTYCNNYGGMTQDERDAQWRTAIGGLQRMVPAHFAYYCCASYPSARKNLNVYLEGQKEPIVWFSAQGPALGLGNEFAIIPGSNQRFVYMCFSVICNFLSVGSLAILLAPLYIGPLIYSLPLEVFSFSWLIFSMSYVPSIIALRFYFEGRTCATTSIQGSSWRSEESNLCKIRDDTTAYFTQRQQELTQLKEKLQQEVYPQNGDIEEEVSIPLMQIR